MFLRVDESLFSLFPEAVIGVLVVRGTDNNGSAPEVRALLDEALESVLESIGTIPLVQHPRIATWREAYRAFGAKPKKYPSSIEALSRRALKGQSLPSINSLVDLYNAVSLRHLVPMGGEDLDAVQGDLVLSRASEDEKAVLLLGDREEKVPTPGEVIYRDGGGAVCRRWNWREADRTKLTEQTRSALLVAEGLPPILTGDIEAALSDLETLIQKFCGGRTRIEILTQSRPQVLLKEAGG